MSAHTPGPWKFGDNSKFFKTNPFNVYVQGGGVHSASIANVPYKKTIPEAEARANALLIAAAPELLEACKAALSDDKPYIEKCRAAIAKATGEQYEN
jgi:hypothetical protein